MRKKKPIPEAHKRVIETLKYLHETVLRPALEEAGLPTNTSQITNEHRAHVTGSREASLLNLLERVFFIKENPSDLASTAIAMFGLGYDMGSLPLGRAAREGKRREALPGLKSGMKRRANREKARPHVVAFIDDYRSKSTSGRKRSVEEALLNLKWDKKWGKRPTSDDTLRQWYRAHEKQKGEELAAGDDNSKLEKLANKWLQEWQKKH